MIEDLFSSRNISPMLLTEGKPFDSPDYLYELKLDGIRSVAYLDRNLTDIRNKRNKMVTGIYPELSGLYRQVKYRCILDGEIIVLKDGKPDFFSIQRRSLMTDSFKISLASHKNPAVFAAFDILYLKDEALTDRALAKRKELLEETVQESGMLSVSRVVEETGITFFDLTVQSGLEGVVAKRKESLYYFGKRSKDWIKFKNLLDEDFIICGFTADEGKIKSLLLGIYRDGVLVDQGHVSLGIPKEEAELIMNFACSHPAECPFPMRCHEPVFFCEPVLVCTVKFMMRTESLSLRQPVYKGLRPDKQASECKLPGKN